MPTPQKNEYVRAYIPRPTIANDRPMNPPATTMRHQTASATRTLAPPSLHRDVPKTPRTPSRKPDYEHDPELATALSDSLATLAIEDRKRKCQNCARGEDMQVYFMCDQCSTIVKKSLRTFTTSHSARMCHKCGHTDGELGWAYCTSTSCEFLTELGRPA
jgi:hypothetical protein